MSKYSIEDTTLTSIANAIRTKDGSSGNIQVSNFAERIAAIPTGGGSSYKKYFNPLGGYIFNVAPTKAKDWTISLVLEAMYANAVEVWNKYADASMDTNRIPLTLVMGIYQTGLNIELDETYLVKKLYDAEFYDGLNLLIFAFKDTVISDLDNIPPLLATAHRCSIGTITNTAQTEGLRFIGGEITLWCSLIDLDKLVVHIVDNLPQATGTTVGNVFSDKFYNLVKCSDDTSLDFYGLLNPGGPRSTLTLTVNNWVRNMSTTSASYLPTLGQFFVPGYIPAGFRTLIPYQQDSKTTICSQHMSHKFVYLSDIE